MNNLENQTASQLINPSHSTLSTGGNENIGTSLNIALFNIAGKTRNIMMQYALLTSAGNINFYALVPFKFNDVKERDTRYRTKTMWASISLDSQRSTRNPEIFFNNNIGILKTFLTPSMMHGEKSVPTPYNVLHANQAKLHQYVVPSDIDSIDNAMLQTLNGPVLALRQKLETVKESGLEGSDLKELNTEAFNEYTQQVTALYDQGLLSLSTIVTTPKADSISMAIGIDETMQSTSNPWLNANVLLNQNNVNLSSLPVSNSIKTLVQVTESGMEALFSDNEAMFGERILNQQAGENEQTRLSLSKVAVIKDFGVNTPILLSIMDGFSTDNRSRVQAFKDQLERGNNLFQVEGTLRPVARHINSNAGRSGVVFFELLIDTYSVHKSTSLSGSIDIDAFGDIGSFDVDLDSVVTEVAIGTEENSTENVQVMD
jgi:hypothetical protein